VLEKSVTGDAHHGDVLSAHVPQLGYLGFRGHGWVLILETPADVAFAPVKTTTRNLLLAGLLVLVGTVLLWFFVARSISGPVLRLRDAALRISRGNFGESVVVRSDDEIGELADAFDNMRYSLQMVIGEYEVMRGGKKKKGVQPIAGIDRSVEKKVKKKGGKVGSKK
jgi:methyl-accepting chemotaxis protein